ncbi:MAG: peptidase M14 [Ruminococcaceae bacterium]|nr:peptidase M14 [Oscillospiraceae bacterium]
MKYEKELDYSQMMTALNELTKDKSYIKMSYIGNSILYRPIPVLTIGEQSAKKSVLYVATHHATESICTLLLLKFLSEFISLHEKGQKACGINLKFMLDARKIHIVPMLNPDGVEYRLHGIEEQNPLYSRVMKYSNGDFSKWSSNARGVDLNHNYDAGFYEYKMIEKEQKITQGPTKYSGESPESEPEVSALASFVRYNIEELCGVLTLHSQGEEIYYKSAGMCPQKSEFVSKQIAKMTSYKLSSTQGTASYGGLTDWLVQKYNLPSFTLECGLGENPLNPSLSSDIYLRLRELFFTFPILF